MRLTRPVMDEEIPHNSNKDDKDEELFEVLRRDGFSEHDLKQEVKVKIDGLGRMSPTAFYARTGNLKMLKHLAKEGALEASKMGSMGRSPMSQAIMGGNKACARLLFDSGACDKVSDAMAMPGDNDD